MDDRYGRRDGPTEITIRFGTKTLKAITDLIAALKGTSEITPEMIAAATRTAQQTQDKLKASLEKGPPPK